MRRGVIASLVLILILAGALLITPSIRNSLEYRALKSGARIGWTRQEVIQHLGTPSLTEKSLDDLKKISISGGFAPPNEPVDNEVLVYQKTFWRAYVYIDKHNRVTYIHMSRT